MLCEFEMVPKVLDKGFVALFILVQKDGFMLCCFEMVPEVSDNGFVALFILIRWFVALIILVEKWLLVCFCEFQHIQNYFLLNCVMVMR
ncbi:hypothetical protein DVH24_013370 [Malus domestica]|uniref:Uncharacterized protein n=1 Tax=Malus domestica TaxID=3750 RepID=A0A498HJX5_MALDO|nr:hypothetical protein DVH24_013370 [Malus domestica]